MIERFEQSIKYLPEFTGEQLVDLLGQIFTVAAMQDDNAYQI